ncbi:hypothetical protein [Streptomyces sp. OE57]|uniref:hypothetical protein n=1 Tax=Streptomyces lacaronensis TaxID=3379885 RepID=UPI0039B72284
MRSPSPARRSGTPLGLLQKHPDRPFVHGEHLRERLTDPPAWPDDLVAHVTARNCVARACGFITRLDRLLHDGQPHSPQALPEPSRRPARSMGSFAPRA